jgi:hypothetical protein
MSREVLVAEFQDYAKAHLAFSGLLRCGIRPIDIAVVTRAKSGCCNFNHDLGILELNSEKYRQAVRCGRTLLVVEADYPKVPWVERLIGRFAPIEIDTLHSPVIHAEVQNFTPATEYNWN